MDPMTIMGIGSAVAGGLQSIFGGKAQGAAIRAQNEQAFRNWIAANTQKTFNNAREQFQAAYAFEQQLKRNKAISDAAYQYQYEALGIAKTNQTRTENDMSSALRAQQSSLLNSMVNKGISPMSSSYSILAMTQALDAVQKAGQLKANALQERNEINKQFKGMLSQQTENIFMPNIEGYDEAPIFGNPNIAEAGGMLSGLVQIGGAIGAAAMPTSNPTSNNSDLGFNPSNNAYTNRTSGGSVGGR
jgi:hypothetical protein